MRLSIKALFALVLLSSATTSSAWFGNNNGWGNNWNPYDEWDPRYWMEEMENAFDDDDYYGGPYGGGPGYGYGPYGGGPGYGAPYGGGPGYGYGAPYGGGPGYGYGPR